MKPDNPNSHWMNFSTGHWRRTLTRKAPFVAPSSFPERLKTKNHQLGGVPSYMH